MKDILILLVAIIIATTAFAQAPSKMSYQTVIRNSANALVTGQNIGIQISILQSSATGTAVYVERHFPTTNANGLASLEIGTGTVISGTFAAIAWGSNTYFVKTEIDVNGGANYTISGTSQFLSVPYALHAETASTVIGGMFWAASGNNIYNSNSGNVGIGTSAPSSMLTLKSSATTGAQIELTNPTDTSSIFLSLPTPTATGGVGTLGKYDLVLFAGGADWVTVKKNGNVGIRNNNPLEALEVGSYASAQDNYISVKTAGGNLYKSGLKLRNYADDDGFTIESDETQNLLKFIRYAGIQSVSMAIDRLTGNIGIGTIAPGYLLQVNGSAGKPGGGTWTAASDARLKDQVVPYSDGLQAILAINPVKFHYNEKSGIDTKKEYIGVLAQDLQKVAPYMVGSFKKDGEDYLDVDNSAMTYMLINAVKEQQAEIKTLRAELDELKAIVKELKK